MPPTTIATSARITRRGPKPPPSFRSSSSSSSNMGHSSMRVTDNSRQSSRWGVRIPGNGITGQRVREHGKAKGKGQGEERKMEDWRRRYRFALFLLPFALFLDFDGDLLG